MADLRISALTDGSPAQAADAVPVSRTAGVATRRVTAQSIADLKVWANLTGIPATFAPSAHHTSHEDSGSDEILVTGLSGLLADAQKVTVRKNSGADVGTRQRINLIEGSNVTLTVADDGANNEVDVTIAASGGAGGGDVTGPASAVDGEVVLYDGATGKLIKRLSGTGVVRAASGVASVAELSGDATTSGSNAVTISNNAVTFAKMADMGTDRLIGRDTAASGDPEEITVGGGLEFTGSAGIQRSALTGDVTASAGNNATTIANDAVTYAKMQNVSAASKLLGRGDSGSGDPQEITLGTNLSMSGTTLNASGSGGFSAYGTQQTSYDTDSTERTLLSFTVTGGDLSTNKRLQFFLAGSCLFNSGTPTYTLRIKYGSTSLFGDVTASVTASATRRYWQVWGQMFNNGSASAQVAVFTHFMGIVTAASVAGVGDITTGNGAWLYGGHGGGTAAENSATNLTFSVTWQFSVSNVNVNMISAGWAVIA